MPAPWACPLLSGEPYGQQNHFVGLLVVAWQGSLVPLARSNFRLCPSSVVIECGALTGSAQFLPGSPGVTQLRTKGEEAEEGSAIHAQPSETLTELGFFQYSSFPVFNILEVGFHLSLEVCAVWGGVRAQLSAMTGLWSWPLQHCEDLSCHEWGVR